MKKLSDKIFGGYIFHYKSGFLRYKSELTVYIYIYKYKCKMIYFHNLQIKIISIF